MDQRTNRFQSGSLNIAGQLFFLVLVLVTISFCQNEIIREYRYNDVVVTFENNTERAALMMNIRNDSLLLLENGLQKWYSYKNLRNIQVQSLASPAAANWAGFFSGIWLGNFLLYGTGETEPTALMTRDYPEGIGAIGINALFGVVGMGIGYIFAPVNVTSGFSLAGEDQVKYSSWQKFKLAMQGQEERAQNRLHLQIQTGSLGNRVLSTYQNKLVFDEHQRTASYFNVLRKIQLHYSVYNNIRLGIAMINQGEPTISGSAPDGEYAPVWMTIRFDAVGYYGTVAYALAPQKYLTAFELIVGAGLGSVKTDLEFFESNQNIYTLSGNYTSITLYAELHAYLSNFFSLSLSADYCTSPNQTIPAFETINLNEEQVNFGNSSFGLGLGYHF